MIHVAKSDYEDYNVHIFIFCCCLDEVNQYACLQAHNDKRALHQNTPGLVWDDALAQHAKDWADHLAATGQLNHDPKLQTYGEGENLYHAFAQTVKSCSRAVEIW